MKHRIGKKGSPVSNKRAAGIFFTDGSCVLLLKRGKGSHEGTWSLPGGGANKGETDIGTAIRETKEETGIESIPGHRFDSFESRDGLKKFTTFMYRVDEQFDVTLSDEHTDWEWISLDELKSKELHPKFEENLPRYLKLVRRKVKTFAEWVSLTNLI